MARDQEIIICPLGVYTEITNSDAEKITYQLQEGPAMSVRLTPSGDLPTPGQPGLNYKTGEGVRQIPLTEIAFSAVNKRVYVKPVGAGNRPATSVKVLVDHL
jgi:hypothetical protein